MNTEEVKKTIEQAQITLRVADLCAKDLAQILVGRLRQVNRDGGYYAGEILKDLKCELRDFNSTKRTWKK